MNTYEVHDLRSRETKPVSQSRRERKHRGSKRKKKKARIGGWMGKERKKERGGRTLFNLFYVARIQGPWQW